IVFRSFRSFRASAVFIFSFFFQAEDGIRDDLVTGVQTCALPIYHLLWPRDLRSIAHAMHLGWYVVISQLCWYVYSHADLTIVGRSEERRVGKECQWRGASYQYTRSETHDKSADE